MLRHYCFPTPTKTWQQKNLQKIQKQKTQENLHLQRPNDPVVGGGFPNRVKRRGKLSSELNSRIFTSGGLEKLPHELAMAIFAWKNSEILGGFNWWFYRITY